MLTSDTNKYDIFLSYTHFDDGEQLRITKLVSSMETIFRALTGRILRVFLDIRTIDTAQIWEERILHAIENSTVLVAILTPSYFTSEWCGKEWDYFINLENKSRASGKISAEQGLIFPIKLIDWNRILRLSDIEQRRLAEASRRQFINFENLFPGEKAFEDRVKNLMDDIITTLSHLENRTRLTNSPENTNFGMSQFNQLNGPNQFVARLGTNREQFIQRLSQAARVTIIGITHEKLIEYLQQALDIKKREQGPEAFWLSIRIIFPSEAVLAVVFDDLVTEFPKRIEANLKRTRIAGQAKRAISYFLIREGHPQHWYLYEYDFMLPFTGAIFEMQDGQKVVQIATIRPGYKTHEHLFFEFSSEASIVAYYQAAFEEIIHHSLEQDEIVLVGTPQFQGGYGFICQHARFRRSVLLPNPDSKDWLAAVLIILWHEVDGKAKPLLQIRTSENATRELDRLSNLSGYINQQDCQEFDTGKSREFLLLPSAYENATRRELQEELDIKDFTWPKPELVGEARFYYPDRENLYFYICRVKIDFPLHWIQPVAQLRDWTFQEILKVREYQVLSMACTLLDMDKNHLRQLNLAIQVMYDNLILHRQMAIAQRLIATVQLTENEEKDFQELQKELRALMIHCQVKYDFNGKRRTVLGLAGLQYREFFSVLVPVYASLGVEGAAEYLEWLRTDEVVSISFERLQAHYANAQSIHDAILDL
ncbi:MAG TPA: TIR domain-containing protein [Ktedonobacteraceae bacterium]|nr:TIR domain-containing protein [Ktedonobacteraceae bacterium]